MTDYPSLDDPESAQVPEEARVWDAHVHLFPTRVFEAIWRWFSKNAWQVRYRLDSEQVLAFLAARGVERVTGLCYSHVPGMAEDLNAHMADLSTRHALLVGLGTVLPGEPDAEEVVARAFGVHGLRGLKLHCHVQALAADDRRLDPIYAAAAAANRPVVIHAGPAPACAGYRIDPRAVCTVEAVDRALSEHPGLTLIVPHLGADLYAGFERLLDRHPGLYLDTTMAIANYFEHEPGLDLLRRRSDRLLFGTDFPNLPYAWDRELKRVLAAALPRAAQEAILWGNAERLFTAG